MNKNKKPTRESFTGQYEETLRKWAPSVGLDPDVAVFIESVLNPYNMPWRDLQNMKARVLDYAKEYGNAPKKNNLKNSKK